jgi:hypothetical protein
MALQLARICTKKCEKRGNRSFLTCFGAENRFPLFLETLCNPVEPFTLRGLFVLAPDVFFVLAPDVFFVLAPDGLADCSQLSGPFPDALLNQQTGAHFV